MAIGWCGSPLGNVDNKMKITVCLKFDKPANIQGIQEHKQDVWIWTEYAVTENRTSCRNLTKNNFLKSKYLHIRF